MNQLKNDLILWRVLSVCYLVCIIITIGFIGAILQCITDGYPLFSDGNIRRTMIMIGVGALFGIITVCVRLVLVRKSSVNFFKTPCEVKIPSHDEETFISMFSNKLKFEMVDEHVWYAERLGRRSLRVFVFSVQQDDMDDVFSYADACVETVNEQKCFPKLITFDMHQTLGRVQIFMFDSVPISLMKEAAKDVEDCIKQPEFLVNMFVGLQDGVLFIPYCRSRIIGVGRLYQYAVSRVGAWLGI